MPLRPDDDLFRIWASAVCADAEGRILLSHRRDFDLWNLPGGKLDAGELPLETVHRELAEETGLEAVASRLVGIYGRADGSAALTLSYAVSARGTLRASDEADLHLWLPLEDWPANAHPGHRDRVPDALAPPGPVVSRRQAVRWGRDHLAHLRRDGLADGELEPFQRDQPDVELEGLVEAGPPQPGRRGRYAQALAVLGRTEEAVEILTDEFAHARERGDARAELATLVRLATARWYGGGHAAAELELWQAVAISSRLPDEPLKDLCYQHLGKCAAERHHWDEAAEYLGRALRLREGGAPELVASTRRALEAVEARRRQPAVG